MEAGPGTLTDDKPYDNTTYVSFQKYINSDSGFLDEDKFEQHLDMIQSQEIKNFQKWEEVYPDGDLFNFKDAKIKPGDRIRYVSYDYDYDFDTGDIQINDKLLFRTGGFVIEVADDFLCYKSHANTNTSIQDKTLYRLFVLRRIKKVKEPKLIIFKKPTTTSKFSVSINGIQIADFDTKYKMERFMKTQKYNNALNGAKFNVE